MKKTMRISCGLLALCLLLLLAAPALADQPRIILYTAYTQMGWGDRMQAGAVDEKGNLWTLSGSAGDLGWPYGWEEQLEYMKTTGNMTYAGKLDSDDLFDLKGLIASAEAQEAQAAPWMNDAGTERSYAIRYDGDGSAQAVLLGMTGDDLFENTDPNAQALYRMLRELFPEVTCYAGMAEHWGFTPVPLYQFLRLDPEKVAQASVKAADIDCEAGPMDVPLSPEEQQEIISLVLTGMVAGKANASAVTGGTTAVSFYDAEDAWFGSLELYRGLLVTNDGMYLIQR